MDAPLVLTTSIDPAEVDKESHNLDVMGSYPLELYLAGLRYAHPREIVSLIDRVEHRLGTPAAMEGFLYTHETSDISAGPLESTYTQLKTMIEKLEAELVSDPRLLLVAVCALNHWRLADILARYQLDEPECLGHLLRLDRMRLIDLLPGNRIRVNVTRDFHWRPGGPIERYFAGRGRDDFLSGGFDGPHEEVFFVHGMLTAEARAQFRAQLEKLRRHFASLHDDSQSAPIGERRGTGMLLALREWEPPDFARLRRPDSPSPS